MNRNDYYFVSKSGHFLAEESLIDSQVGDYAQKLARRHQTTVQPCLVVGAPVEPDKCPNCGLVLPESGPCWHDRFEEEEDPDGVALADFCGDHPYKRDYNPWESIPFQGEAYPAKVYSEFEEYF